MAPVPDVAHADAVLPPTMDMQVVDKMAEILLIQMVLKDPLVVVECVQHAPVLENVGTVARVARAFAALLSFPVETMNSLLADELRQFFREETEPSHSEGSDRRAPQRDPQCLETSCTRDALGGAA